MRVRLQTERLVLRDMTVDDGDALVELDSDPEVTHFITGGKPTSHEEMEQKILSYWLGFHEQGPLWGFFATLDRSTGEFLGWFHLRAGDGHGDEEPELGYRLKRSAWGRGLATEGSQALVDSAFRDGGATRVLAETMVVNSGSRRVMEKVGMRLVRVFHADWPHPIPGDEHGDVEYAIERADWERRRSV